ncbi:MAG: hypothetical protein QF565_17520 [Arenicellales bacterium]|nr:hypothetical protein [Arenicellales bacterium]
MISLTDLPHEDAVCWVLPCTRNPDRRLVFRADDPDNKEVVLFVSEYNAHEADRMTDEEGTALMDDEVARQVNTAVVMSRTSLVMLAHSILEVALEMRPDDGGGSDPGESLWNGAGP